MDRRNFCDFAEIREDVRVATQAMRRINDPTMRRWLADTLDVASVVLSSLAMDPAKQEGSK